MTVANVFAVPASSRRRSLVAFVVALTAACGFGVLNVPVARAQPPPPGSRGSQQSARLLPRKTPKTPAAQKTTPVVNGVRRSNVANAHSPQLQHAMSGLRQERGSAAAASGSGAHASARSSAAPVMGPAQSATTMRGVDVAAYQHPNSAAINWSKVATAGYRFAFVKATEGDYYTNPYVGSDVSQARSAGMDATGYVFAIPNVSGGANQAEYALAHARSAAIGETLPLALDIEYDPYASSDGTNECYGLTATKMVSWISAFVAATKRLTGRAPIIYTTADWWDSCTGDSAAFAADPLWVAAYDASSPTVPRGWSTWTFWQYTSGGTVPGISASGDTDVSDANAAMASILDPGGGQGGSGAVIEAYGGRCLDDPAGNTTDGTRLDLWGCNGGINQRWTIHTDGTIRAFGKCLDVDGAGTTDGTPVDLYACDGTGAQQWLAGTDGELVNPNSGKCLDDPGFRTSDGTKLNIWDCNGGTNEHWEVPAAPYRSQAAATCLDDPGSATANGTTVDLWGCNGGANQNWSVEPDGTIRALGRCLDDPAGRTANGTRLDLWTCNGGTNQRWRVRPGGTVSVLGKCLTDPSGSGKYGIDPVLEPCPATSSAKSTWRAS